MSGALTAIRHLLMISQSDNDGSKVLYSYNSPVIVDLPQ